MSYHRINNLTGILVFCIAATVYCLTVEPTASLWDCSEFILSSYKLEVGHPPGAPFFMLTANLFTQFINDPALVARMVNYMSALLSAATIWLLYLSITHLTRKLLCPDNTPVKPATIITVIASGIAGALVYTFSDTFWFSAVEGEVYAYSSLFTALVFWLILKWEDETDEEYADRWLILIAYLTGLSIGVHLLSLLCLPAIVLIFYYKKHPNATIKGSLLAVLVSAILIFTILYGIVPGVIKVGGWFELLFVNRFGLPFHSGVIAYLILLGILLAWGIYESQIKRHLRQSSLALLLTAGLLGIPFYGYGWNSIIIGVVILAAGSFYLFSKKISLSRKPSLRTVNTLLLCLIMIITGYSSYAVIVIRSTANTPMDQNSPEDIFTLGSYLAREQYGQRPLLYGHSFLSKPHLKRVQDGWVYDYRKGKPVYKQKAKENENEKDSYVVAGNSWEKIYAQNMLFPRMYDPAHADSYRQWVSIKGKQVVYNQAGEQITLTVPTQWENLRFFISYQLNHMYWRYFLWNFVGRQNDIQGNGEMEYGNWITGIPCIDNLLVGNQELLPTELKENKGRNVYYGLPLLLGIIGICWQFKSGKSGKQSFFTVFMLFFMTGIAIILYLNQTPVQPRERDYAYAGSFYAFAIWIGMGVAGITHLINQRVSELPAAIIASLLCICIPIQMAGQTWDDHDRSGRYVCRDTGRNYLVSSPEGNYPVIFTMADNETFPLWYNQEVEAFRTDVRICNVAYLQCDWYIDPMKRNYYDSPKLPIPWSRKEYMMPETQAIPVRPELKEVLDNYYRMEPEEARKEFGENPYEVTNILNYWVRPKDNRINVIPSDSLVIKIDEAAVRRSGMKIPEVLNGKIPEYMHISLKGREFVTRSELMMLEILVGCNWERPVYITTSMGADGRFCFENNLCQEGLLYHITPFNTTLLDSRMDSEKTYDCLVNKFEWGGIENPHVYMDETALRMYHANRLHFAGLAETLLKEGKTEKALNALNHCLKVIPAESLPYDFRNGSMKIAECYYRLDENQKADEIMSCLADKSVEYIIWYLSLNKHHWYRTSDMCMYHLYLLNEENKIMEKYGSGLSDTYLEKFEELYLKTESRYSALSQACL